MQLLRRLHQKRLLRRKQLPQLPVMLLKEQLQPTANICDVTKQALSSTGVDTPHLSIMARVRHVKQLEAELGRDISFPLSPADSNVILM